MNIDQYTKETGHSVHSRENQEICGQLVAREIGHCVSSLVHHFATNTEALEGSGYYWENDILPLCEIRDHEEACRNEGWIPDDEASAFSRGRAEVENGGASFIRMEDGRAVEFSDADDWEELANDENIEPETREVFEHWIVSDWMAKRLAEHGHPTGELFNLTIWGRPTTGQSILLDGVIAAIACEMGILHGQECSWHREAA